MAKTLLASLALALVALCALPAKGATPTEETQVIEVPRHTEVIIVPLPEGSTVSHLCQAIPRNVRGDSIMGCAWRALELSDIEDDRKIHVGTPITIPIAPAVEDVEGDVVGSRSSSTPSQTVSPQPERLTEQLVGYAAGVVLAVIVIAGIIAAAIGARRTTEKKNTMNDDRNRDRGYQGRHQRDQGQRNGPDERARRAAHEDEAETPEDETPPGDPTPEVSFDDAFEAFNRAAIVVRREAAELRAENERMKAEETGYRVERERLESRLRLADQDNARLSAALSTSQTQLEAARKTISSMRRQQEYLVREADDGLQQSVQIPAQQRSSEHRN